MMSVAVTRCSGKARHQYVWPEVSNHAHQIRDRDLMSAPFFEGLFGSLGETKIGDAGEALLDSVVIIGGQKLQGAKHSEFVGEGVARLVLAALAAGKRA